MQETQVRSLGQEDSLEESMAAHSRILAWRIPRTEEPGGLQSMGSQSQSQLSDDAFPFPLIIIISSIPVQSSVLTWKNGGLAGYTL